MNVTVTIDEELCRKARHRAVDKGQSLSRWIADVISKEIQSPSQKMTLLEALADEESAEKEFEAPRSKEMISGIDFR